jgi:hypothetical protein
MVNRLGKGAVMLRFANSAHSISPRRSGATRTRFGHAMEALIAIAVPTAIIAAALLLILTAVDLRAPSVQFTGASLTVRFDPPPH